MSDRCLSWIIALVSVLLTSCGYRETSGNHFVIDSRAAAEVAFHIVRYLEIECAATVAKKETPGGVYHITWSLEDGSSNIFVATAGARDTIVSASRHIPKCGASGLVDSILNNIDRRSRG